MTDITMADQTYTRDLGDGLLLRWSTADDAERIGTLYNHVFRRKAEEPNPFIATWAHELISGDDPLITANDFAVVERTSDGAIVASTCLLTQPWSYDGVVFPIGRPEIVASLPEYRNRGLVRAVFELIHARSARRGDLVQGITGIPYYYRQFGYEFAFDLGGAKFVPFTNIPKLKDGETETFRLRNAVESDLPLIERLYERERNRLHAGLPLLVSTPIDQVYWRYALTTPKRESGEGFLLKIIENDQRRGIGYTIVHPMRWGEQIQLRGLMVDEGVSLLQVLPSLLRAMPVEAETLIKRRDDIAPASRIDFGLGRAHPAYDALGDKALGEDPPYAWYVRVPDVPAFIHLIKSVLEQRIALSYVPNYTGELRLSFYRGGMRLLFENGAIRAEPWQQDHNWGPRPQAAFPPLVFLQLLFGHRSMNELRAFLPDVWAEDEAKQLLDILFPKRISWAINIE